MYKYKTAEVNEQMDRKDEWKNAMDTYRLVPATRRLGILAALAVTTLGLDIAVTFVVTREMFRVRHDAVVHSLSQ